MSAKKKPAEATKEQSDQKKDTGEAKAQAEKKEAASEETVKDPVVRQKPSKETELLAQQKEKAKAPEKEPSALLSESQPPTSDKEPETPKSGIEEVSEPDFSSTYEEEEKIPPDVIPSEDRDQNPPEHIAEEKDLAEEEEIPSEEVVLSYATDLKQWLSRKTLTVTERSDSRAQRYYNKGVSYQQQGKPNRAIDSYRKALSFNPDHVPAHINLATAYLQTGRFKEAEKELIYVYALRPKDCQILFNFGLLLYQTGELASAETKLKKLLELDPFQLETNLLLASVYEEKGELNQAIEHCMRAYRTNSTDPRVIYRLGRTWDMVGDRTKAAEYYQLFLNMCSKKESELKLAVRDRLNYLVSQKEEK
jgi:tetratricopeptide (TPR) repeat protein